MITADAKLILSQAQSGIQSLMERELAAKRYGDLAELARLAEGLANLYGSGVQTIVSSPSKPEQAEGESSPKAQKRAPKKKSIGRAKQGYPRFEFRNAMIVKIGWSKKAQKEYEHSAPVQAAIDLALQIQKTTQTGRIWTVEELGDVMLSHDESELPSYQLYLLIAWMRTIRVISKQGRSGYIATSGAEIVQEVKEAIAKNRIQY